MEKFIAAGISYTKEGTISNRLHIRRTYDRKGEGRIENNSWPALQLFILLGYELRLRPHYCMEIWISFGAIYARVYEITI